MDFFCGGTRRGITGTSTKRRKNFNRMIDDAMVGRIDRIINKSVSRFSFATTSTP